MAKFLSFLRRREPHDLPEQGSAEPMASEQVQQTQMQPMRNVETAPSQTWPEQGRTTTEEGVAPEHPRQIGMEQETVYEQYEQRQGVTETEQITPQRTRPQQQQPGVQIQTPTTTQAPKTKLYRTVEALLADDLEAIYNSLDPQTQLQFRQKGEETVSKIEVLISTAKATAQAIVELIRTWLTIIPGVNRFFLEQESKLKTDRIMKIVQEQNDELTEKY
jgi:hypothetical protein